jgi:Flavodoxin-like fold
MTEAERRSYMGPAYDGHLVAEYITTLKRIEGIIFCFPHWWFAMPAVLKGYVDRVWALGTAFTYGTKHRDLQPNLQNVRLFGVVTSYGSPWWNVRVLAGDPGRKVLMRGLKPLCGKGVRSMYVCPLRYGPPYDCFASRVLGDGSGQTPPYSVEDAANTDMVAVIGANSPFARVDSGGAGFFSSMQLGLGASTEFATLDDQFGPIQSIGTRRARESARSPRSPET